MADISELLGLTLTACEYDKDRELIRFTVSDGRQLVMGHVQDCCESVNVEDICGDLTDLVGTPILRAEDVSSSRNPEKRRSMEFLGMGAKPGDEQESWSWTFYKLATIKGDVVIRWYGSSNGYYSEAVDTYWSDNLPYSWLYR